jgi:tetratricopeptide (TPR) repeat protein
MVSGSSNALQEFLQTGFQQLQQGRPQEAWNAFHQALRLDPGNAWAHHMVGLIAMQAGQLEMGIKSVQRSIAIDPNDPAAHANLANGLRDLGRLDEALAEYDRALAMAPNFLDALNNRAVLHGRAGRSKEALRDYDRAIAIDPGVAFLHNNRAATLVELGRHPEAVVAYEACLKLNPELADAGFNSGTAYLALGDYARGWERYEWRFAMRGPNRFVSDRGFAQPYWRGETSIAGKTLLLHSEQGLGDSIQFCRYADLAKAAGARVILEVEKPLTRLFASLKGADLVLEKGSALPDFDLHASLMSLPRAFRTTLATIPADIPYLHARPDEVRAWAVKLDTQTPPPPRGAAASARGPRVVGRLPPRSAQAVGHQRPPQHRAENARPLGRGRGRLRQFAEGGSGGEGAQDAGGRRLERPGRDRLRKRPARFRRHRRPDRDPRPGCDGGHLHRPLGRGARQAGLDSQPHRRLLALAAGPDRQSLVSDRAPVPAEELRRLGASDRGGGCGVEGIPSLKTSRT